MLLIASKIFIWLILALVLGFVAGVVYCKYNHDELENFSSVLLKPENSEILNPIEEPICKQDTQIKEEIAQKQQSKQEKDDLTKIKGIGSKLEENLNQLGIYTYRQIASWDEDDIKYINENLKFKGKTKREDWVLSAKEILKSS